MILHLTKNQEEMGLTAAQLGAQKINAAIASKGRARIILATGNSQLKVIEHLLKTTVDWSVVEVFHLDEYVGMAESHPASFRRYLREKFVNRAGNLKKFYPVNADSTNLAAELDKLAIEVTRSPIDVAFVGIGENAHLAFNDPPADFSTADPYILVDLDQKCRQQQLGEGWFDSIQDVPKQAVSMSIRQILTSTTIICSVPEERKAQALRQALEEEITPAVPASILRRHQQTHLVIDQQAASQLQFANIKLGENNFAAV